MSDTLHTLANKGLLVIPHVRVQNANAISSPLTHGFPAMGAFLGLMWALERKLAQAHIGLSLEKVGVVCHWHEEQVHEGYVKTFRLTRNPVGKDGSTAAIVEEGRMHLDISLVFQVDGGPADMEGNLVFADPALQQETAWTIRNILSTMRIAGGSVIHQPPTPGQSITPKLLAIAAGEDGEQQLRLLRRRLLPGFALVSRDDLLQQRLAQLQAQNSEATALDAWLDLCRFNWRSESRPEAATPQASEAAQPAPAKAAAKKGAAKNVPIANSETSADPKAEKVQWKHDRPANAGWLVPIPVGYGALSDLYEGGTVANARDASTPFRFVESLYSVGQWLSPHRIQSLTDILWWADSQPQNGLYRCRNDYAPPAPEMDDAPPAPALAPAPTAQQPQIA